MITCNGVVGLAVLAGALRRLRGHLQRRGLSHRARDRAYARDPQPRAAHLHHEQTGAPALSAQLAFAAVASLALYGLFVVVQTVRHREYYVSPSSQSCRIGGAR